MNKFSKLRTFLFRKKGRSETKQRWLDYLYMMIVIILFLQILRIPIGGKTMMSPDQMASDSFGPMNRVCYEKGEIPQWNPYIFSGMAWAFYPHFFVAEAVLLHLPMIIIKKMRLVEVGFIFLLFCLVMQDCCPAPKTKEEIEEYHESNKVIIALTITAFIALFFVIMKGLLT